LPSPVIRAEIGHNKAISLRLHRVHRRTR
jgi:hypothetical protein